MPILAEQGYTPLGGVIVAGPLWTAILPNMNDEEPKAGVGTEGVEEGGREAGLHGVLEREPSRRGAAAGSQAAGGLEQEL